MWGKIRIPDPQCGAAPPVKPPTPCFDHTGPFGAYRPDLVNKGWIPTGTSFALIALNWIPPTGTGWTMIAGDPGRMATVERVTPATYPGKLDPRFLFVVDQTQCPSSKVGYLRYGDFIQLRSINTSQYAQCGAGTCSLTNGSGNCTNTDWHTFIVTSFNNSKALGDQVCFGDEITIQQTVGSHANITAAGGSDVWACDQGNCNMNYRLRIVPDSGSIYADPAQEMDAYNKQRTNLSCNQNPAQPQCIATNPLWRILLIVIIASIAALALSQVVRALRGDGGGGGAGAREGVTIVQAASPATTSPAITTSST